MKRKFLAAFVLLLLTGQALSTGVHSIQVTIGAGTTQISTSDLFVKQVVFQNNAAHDMRLGGSETTSTIGIALISTAHGSASVLPMYGYPVAINLKEWYVAGTQNDVIDITYVQ